MGSSSESWEVEWQVVVVTQMRTWMRHESIGRLIDPLVTTL